MCANTRTETLGQKPLVLQLSRPVWNWCMENQICLLMRSLPGSLCPFAMTLPPYNLRVTKIWQDTLLQSSGWVWWRPWTCSSFCGCIWCRRHFWCLWFQQPLSPKGNINDVDADWSYLGIKNCCWWLYRHFCLSKFANKTLGLCVTPSLQLLTQLLIWRSLCWCNQCFLNDFPGCLWLIRGPKQLLSWWKFCGLCAVQRSAVEHPVVTGWSIYHLAK